MIYKASSLNLFKKWYQKNKNKNHQKSKRNDQRLKKKIHGKL